MADDGAEEVISAVQKAVAEATRETPPSPSPYHQGSTGASPFPSPSPSPTAASPPEIASVSGGGEKMRSTIEEQSEDDAASEASNEGDEQEAITVLTPELIAGINKQITFYFSDINLPTDKKFLKQIMKDPEGFVAIKIFANFRKVRAITKEVDLITEALKYNEDIVLSEDGTRARRKHPVPEYDIASIQSRTIVVENLPESPTIESVTEMFSAFGTVKLVRICSKENKGKLPQWLSGSCRNLIQQHAFVEFESEESAIMATASLHEADEWMNGLKVCRVKPTGSGLTSRRSSATIWGPPGGGPRSSRSTNEMSAPSSLRSTREDALTGRWSLNPHQSHGGGGASYSGGSWSENNNFRATHSVGGVADSRRTSGLTSRTTVDMPSFSSGRTATGTAGGGGGKYLPPGARRHTDEGHLVKSAIGVSAGAPSARSGRGPRRGTCSDLVDFPTTSIAESPSECSSSANSPACIMRGGHAQQVMGQGGQVGGTGGRLSSSSNATTVTTVTTVQSTYIANASTNTPSIGPLGSAFKPAAFQKYISKGASSPSHSQGGTSSAGSGPIKSSLIEGGAAPLNPTYGAADATSHPVPPMLLPRNSFAAIQAAAAALSPSKVDTWDKRSIPPNNALVGAGPNPFATGQSKGAGRGGGGSRRSTADDAPNPFVPSGVLRGGPPRSTVVSDPLTAAAVSAVEAALAGPLSPRNSLRTTITPRASKDPNMLRTIPSNQPLVNRNTKDDAVATLADGTGSLSELAGACVSAREPVFKPLMEQRVEDVEGFMAAIMGGSEDAAEASAGERDIEMERFKAAIEQASTLDVQEAKTEARLAQNQAAAASDLIATSSAANAKPPRPAKSAMGSSRSTANDGTSAGGTGSSMDEILRQKLAAECAAVEPPGPSSGMSSDGDEEEDDGGGNGSAGGALGIEGGPRRRRRNRRRSRSRRRSADSAAAASTGSAPGSPPSTAAEHLSATVAATPTAAAATASAQWTPLQPTTANTSGPGSALKLKKDYASWAAATPEYRAVSSAAAAWSGATQSPSGSTGTAVAGDVGPGAPGVCISSPLPMLSAGPAAPGSAPRSSAASGGVPGSSEHLVAIAKGPGAPHGFTGRGRLLRPPPPI